MFKSYFGLPWHGETRRYNITDDKCGANAPPIEHVCVQFGPTLLDSTKQKLVILRRHVTTGTKNQID